MEGWLRISNVTRNIINGRPPTNQPYRFFGARHLVRMGTRSAICCGALLGSKVYLFILCESWWRLRGALLSPPVYAGPLSRGAAFRRAVLLLFALERRLFSHKGYNECRATMSGGVSGPVSVLPLTECKYLVQYCTRCSTRRSPTYERLIIKVQYHSQKENYLCWCEFGTALTSRVKRMHTQYR